MAARAGAEPMNIQRPRGTFDVLPDEAARWRFVERTARRVAALYGFGEIRTPIFESTELFVRGVGEATDIVGKEMYTFKDGSGRSLTLRPEGTAPVIRAYIENSLGRREKPARLYYIGPVFRYEKPQAGRYRQHHQFGVELIGAASAFADAEIIRMLMHFYGELGIRGAAPVLNSVGCRRCRPGYNAALGAYLLGKAGGLCADCRRRAETNPLRVFDCKQPGCAAVIAVAPRVRDHICAPCGEHFGELLSLLAEAGISFTVRPELVRGIDYYTRTAFEIVAGELGAQNAVGGGGRYDDLVEMLGGPPTPAVGFGTGIERALMVMREQGVAEPAEGGVEVGVVVWDPAALVDGRRAVRALRDAGVAAEMDAEGTSLRGQMRRLDRRGVPFALLIGDSERARGAGRLKEMRTGEEREISLDRVVEELMGRRGRPAGAPGAPAAGGAG